jgi:hypothetical protein
VSCWVGGDRRVDEEKGMPDVFEVLGAAHREVIQMLDRMQALIRAPAELRDKAQDDAAAKR